GRRRIARLVLPGQAQVPGDEYRLNGSPRHLAGDADSGAVDLGQPVGVADLGQLVLAGVERQHLQDLGASVDELLMDGAQSVGMLNGDLRRERPRLDVTPFLQRQQVAAVAEDDAMFQFVEDGRRHRILLFQDWYAEER